MSKFPTLLVEPNADTAQAIRVACPSDTVVVSELPWSAATIEEPVVVICGPSIDLPSILRFANEFSSREQRVSVIAVRARVDTPTLTSAIRAGISDVVLENDLVELGPAIARARKRSTSPIGTNARAHTSTVCAAKGGVGKTTIATTMAVLLAKNGHRTVLVDLDLEFGDVATTLNLSANNSMAQLNPTSHENSLDIDVVMNLLVQHPSGLYVLSAPPEPSAASTITAEVVGQVLDALVSEFDFIIVDTPPSLNEGVLAAIDRSQTVIMLTTLDVPALKNTRTAITTLSGIGLSEDRLHLVINRADAEAGVRLREVTNALRYPVATAIPSSRDVPATVNAGAILAQTSPSHPVCVAIATLADLIATEPPPIGSPRPSDRQRRIEVSSSRGWSRLRLLWGTS